MDNNPLKIFDIKIGIDSRGTESIPPLKDYKNRVTHDKTRIKCIKSVVQHSCSVSVLTEGAPAITAPVASHLPGLPWQCFHHPPIGGMML